MCVRVGTCVCFRVQCTEQINLIDWLIDYLSIFKREKFTSVILIKTDIRIWSMLANSKVQLIMSKNVQPLWTSFLRTGKPIFSLNIKRERKTEYLYFYWKGNIDSYTYARRPDIPFDLHFNWPKSRKCGNSDREIPLVCMASRDCPAREHKHTHTH